MNFRRDMSNRKMRDRKCIQGSACNATLACAAKRGELGLAVHSPGGSPEAAEATVLIPFSSVLKVGRRSHEDTEARHYLYKANIKVLKPVFVERTSIRLAHNKGRAPLVTDMSIILKDFRQSPFSGTHRRTGFKDIERCPVTNNSSRHKARTSWILPARRIRPSIPCRVRLSTAHSCWERGASATTHRLIV